MSGTMPSDAQVHRWNEERRITVRGHFLVIDTDYEATMYGVYDTFQDAQNSITDSWLRHPSNRTHHRPDIQEWKGDGYVRHWRFEGDELAEIDFT